MWGKISFGLVSAMLVTSTVAQIPTIEAEGNVISLNADTVNIKSADSSMQSVQGMFSTMQQQINDLTKSNAQQVADLKQQIQNLKDQIPDQVNNVLNRNETVFKWASNMDPASATSQGYTNDLTVFIGEFRGNSVVKLDLADGGYYSHWAASFEITGRWGAHLAAENEDYLPVCVTFGAANDYYLSSGYVRFFTRTLDIKDGSGEADHREKYYLYAYFKPLRIPDGMDGKTAQFHQTRVVKSFLQNPYGDSTFAQSQSVPVFSFADWNSTNTGKFQEMKIQLAATQEDVIAGAMSTLTAENIDPIIDAHLTYNDTTHIWDSNYDPDYAAAQGFSNDFVVMIGEFTTSSVIHIDIADNGYFGNFGASVEINGIWGTHLNRESNSPECFSFGAADEKQFDRLKFFIRPLDAKIPGDAAATANFYLYAYMPAYAKVTDTDGRTPMQHRTRINTKVSGDPYSFARFVPRSDTAPMFNLADFNGDNVGKFQALPIQVLSDVNSMATALDKHYSYNDSMYTWQSNLDPGWAASNNQPNDFATCLGQFSTNSVVNVDVTESGNYAEWAVNFQIVAGWGVHTNGGDGEQQISTRVEALSLGTAEEWRLVGDSPQLRMFVRAADKVANSGEADNPSIYYLYAYIKPYTKIKDGRTAYTHKTRIVTKISQDPYSRSKFDAPLAPVFNITSFNNGNPDKMALLKIQTALN